MFFHACQLIVRGAILNPEQLSLADDLTININDPTGFEG
jgi:hypothetical protein